MNQITYWLRALREKLFRRPENEISTAPRATLSADKLNGTTGEYLVETEFSAEVSGRIESMGPGKNVFVSAYGEGHEATVPDLEIVDSEPSSKIGFNPYDTTVLHDK